MQLGSAGVNAIGYRGHSILRVRLRKVPAGDYRITKGLVRAGSGPIEERTITRSVRVRMMGGSSELTYWFRTVYGCFDEVDK